MSVLFFFVLGAAWAVVSVMIIATVSAVVSGGELSELASLFTVSKVDDLLGLPLMAALGGVFTAVCAPLVLRTAPDPRSHTSRSGATVAPTA